MTNALLYRDVREFAVGHGIAATWAHDAGDVVNEVRTAWLPEARVHGIEQNVLVMTEGKPVVL